MSNFQKLSNGVSRQASILGTDIHSGAATSSQLLAADGSGGSAFRSLLAGDLPTITLTSDVTGSGSGGSIATTVAKIQGQTVAGTTGSSNVVFSTGASLSTPSMLTATITGSSTITDAFKIINAATASKTLAFSLTGMSASTALTLSSSQSTTQTLTLPNITGADTVAVLSLAQVLLNKTFTDNVTLFQNTSDTSRKMKFDLTNLTSATTRTITLQDASDTMALLGTNQTFSGTMTLSAAATALTVNNNATISGTLTVGNNLQGSSGVGLFALKAYNSTGTVGYQVQSSGGGLQTILKMTSDGVTGNALYISNPVDKLYLQSNGTTALTIDTSQNSTFAGTIAANGSGNHIFGTSSNNATVLVDNSNQGNALQGRTLTNATSNTTHQQAPYITTQAEIWNGTSSIPKNMGFTNYGVNGTNSAYYGSFESSDLTNLLNIRGDVQAIGMGTAAVSGTGLTVAGNIVTNSQLGIGGLPDNSGGLTVRNTNLSGTTNIGVLSEITGTSSATASLRGVQSTLSTAAAAYTTTNAYNFLAASTSLGAGSSITRIIDLFCANSLNHTATNNATLADNNTFTGNWFINQSGADPSTLGGALTIGGTSVVLGNGSGTAATYFESKNSANQMYVGVNDNANSFFGAIGANVGAVYTNNLAIVLAPAGVKALTLDTSQNATFVGSVQFASSTAGLNKITPNIANTTTIPNATGSKAFTIGGVNGTGIVFVSNNSFGQVAYFTYGGGSNTLTNLTNIGGTNWQINTSTPTSGNNSAVYSTSTGVLTIYNNTATNNAQYQVTVFGN